MSMRGVGRGEVQGEEDEVVFGGVAGCGGAQAREHFGEFFDFETVGAAGNVGGFGVGAEHGFYSWEMFSNCVFGSGVERVVHTEEGIFFAGGTGEDSEGGGVSIVVLVLGGDRGWARGGARHTSSFVSSRGRPRDGIVGFSIISGGRF